MNVEQGQCEECTREYTKHDVWVKAGGPLGKAIAQVGSDSNEPERFCGKWCEKKWYDEREAV